MALLDFLVEKGIIDKKNVKKISDELQTSGRSIDVVLADNDVLSNEILQAKSEYYKVPIKDLSQTEVPFDILKYIIRCI